MNKNLKEKARSVADWPYAVKISKDETTDGKTVYLATHPELIGCMAQGETVEEAVETLKEVTYEYVLSLLEDHVPIPVPPAQMAKLTAAYSSIKAEVHGIKPFIDTLSQVVQPCNRQDISTVEPVTI